MSTDAERTISNTYILPKTLSALQTPDQIQGVRTGDSEGGYEQSYYGYAGTPQEGYLSALRSMGYMPSSQITNWDAPFQSTQGDYKVPFSGTIRDAYKLMYPNMTQITDPIHGDLLKLGDYQNTGIDYFTGAASESGWDKFMGSGGSLLAPLGFGALAGSGLLGAGTLAGEAGAGAAGAAGASSTFAPSSLAEAFGGSGALNTGTFGSLGTGGSLFGGAGGASSLGGGVNFLDSVGSLSNLFGGSGALDLGTFGSIPTGSYGWESFLPGGNLAGSTSGGSIWDSIGNIFGSNPVGTAGNILSKIVAPQDGQQNPDYLKMLGALGSFFTQKDLASKLSQISQQQDPFGSQRGFYQDQLKQSYTDPNFLQNNPTFQAMLDPALRQVNANMARRGLTNSGNALHEIMRTGTETAAKYMLPFQLQTGNFAGSGIDPKMAGILAAQGATTNQNAMGNLGVIGNELWKVLNQRDPMIMNMV